MFNYVKVFESGSKMLFVYLQYVSIRWQLLVGID